MTKVIRRVIMIGVACCAATWLSAAPFAKQITFRQPDGTEIALWGEGDEFHAVFETLDGYTVTFDPADKAYYYAALAADGSNLLSTRLLVGRDAPAPELEKHLRISPEAARAKALERYRRWNDGMQVAERWEEQKKLVRTIERQMADGPMLLAPPAFTTTGHRMGLTLLIDFDNDQATVPRAEIDRFCNADNYTGSGNNGSVKQYFYDNSNGLLIYSNTVTAYIRIPNSLHPKSWYNDTSKDAGSQANLLIRDAIEIMKAWPEYTTEVLPLFDELTVDGGNNVVACNVFYAGDNGGSWANGLWPHSWSLYEVGAQELSPGGMRVFRYQITDIGETLTIGTFCHENGHMLCGYPDIYDYQYDSIGGAGMFCLMNHGGDGGNPVQVCAYLKYASGWCTTVEVNAQMSVLAEVYSQIGSEGYNKLYRYQKPGVDTEYYLFENRQKAGRDARLPASGVAVWHVDELGNRDNQSLAFNANHQNYECTLVQADGQWHFQKNANSGDARDLYYQGNPAPGYSNTLTDGTVPGCRWWDGSKSNMEASNFSASGPVMTFLIAPRPPVMLATGALPEGRVGTLYSYGLGAAGGLTPYSWSLVAGDLPAGLALDANGTLSGMPEEAVTAVPLRFAVTADNGMAATNDFSLTIRPVFTAPFEETFESGGGTPDGWMQEVVSGGLHWSFRNGGAQGRPATAYNGSYNAFFGVATATQHVTRLVSPRLDFGADVRDARLTFWHYMEEWAVSQDELRVYYKTSWAGEWTLLASYTASVASWTQRTVALPDPSREYYIAFEGTAKYGFGVCVDSVRVWDPTPPYAIATESALPDAVTGQPYSQALTAVGGFEPYVFTLADGGLPGDFSLSEDGVISGLTDAAQTSAFTVRVTDDRGNALTKAFTLDVVVPRADLFAEDFERSGQMPYGWTQEYVTYMVDWVFQPGGMFGNPPAAASGNYNACLWSGLWINGGAPEQKTRLISPMINLGQAPAHTRLTFWHCMANWAGGQDELRVYYRKTAFAPWTLLATYASDTPVWVQRSVLLPEPTSTYYLAFEGNARFGYGVCIDDVRINDSADAPIITTALALPNATVGFAYSETLQAVGGVEPYTWSVVSNALPAGLALSTNGVLSGTPESPALAYFRVRVAGADGKASTNLFALRVMVPGPTPYTESFEGGSLPLGWTVETLMGESAWTFRAGSPLGQPASAYAGTKNACFFTATPNITRLVTPALNLGTGTPNTRLTFWHCMRFADFGQDALYVYYKSSAGAEWTLLETFLVNTPTWTQRTINLPDPSTTYYLAFEGRSIYGSGYGLCLDEVVITGDFSPYENWKATMFTSEERTEGLITGDGDDPDGDGLANGVEYALGLDPRIPDSDGRPIGGILGGYLLYSYRESKQATDVVFEVEVCDDLAAPVWTTADVSEVLRADSNTWWQVTTRCDTPVGGAPSRFMRLKVTLP